MSAADEKSRLFKESEESLVGSGISGCSGECELQQENSGATDQERASLSASSKGLWKDEREERCASDRLR